MRRARRILLGVSAALLVLPSTAAAALPNLVSDPAERPALQVNSDGTQEHLLLRFDSFIHNAGPGPMELRGAVTTRDGPADSVTQYEDGTDPISLPDAEMVWARTIGSGFNEDGHNHWHFQRAVEYSLVGANDDSHYATAAKVGFCMVDSQRMTGNGPYVYGGPGACLDSNNIVVMGVSAGFRDIYANNLMWQWVDVSDTLPGNYRLRSIVDPDDVIEETNEVNTPADIAVTLPGYRPRAGNATRPSASDSVTLSLGTDSYGSNLDPPEFTLVDPPDHGTVTLGTGWTTDPVVTYTPNPGAPGNDSFRFAVREAGSPFPRTPPSATVSIGTGAATEIAIGGVPGQLLTGTSVQFTSSPQAESWSASAGTITPGGFFTAPATVPPGGSVTITAQRSDGGAGRVTIPIIPQPAPSPAPLPPGAPTGEPVGTHQVLAPTPPVGLPRRALSKLRAARTGRFISVSVLAGQSGRLKISLRKGKRRIRGCTFQVRRGVTYTCRIARPRGERSRIGVVASMRTRNGFVAVRRATVAAPRAHRH